MSHWQCDIGFLMFSPAFSHPFCIQDQASDVGVLLADADGIFYSIKFFNAELDFRFPMGAPLRGINSFLSTNQLKLSEAKE
ncbi:zeta-carotene desaturase, chloroplastic/chromoplastic-like [Arachis duranensis]|uniref:Zeta-carotene desaturase, chloroplastic/chromoplastic-like n=1 Tax=Arachis duranensis TaxID=130453 RepID=A0A9C6TL74_ARADU|nr:zeta-carotene desaturase, chloroplastic/chromoplastic-like [Arachis duranensis]